MKKIISMILAIAGIALVSCNKTDDNTLLLSNNEFRATSTGASMFLTIGTNSAWNISSNDAQDWVSLSQYSGSGYETIVIKVSANISAERSAEFLVSTGALSETFTVSQPGGKSDIRFGMPYVSIQPQAGKANSLYITVPYSNAAGTESVDFTVSSSSEEFPKGTINSKDFKQGNGEVVLNVNCTPATMGPVALTVSTEDGPLAELDVRVGEPYKYKKFISWNFWGTGYSRNDFCMIPGSRYDQSWSSIAVKATTSGKAEDHRVLPTACTLDGCSDAYFSARCTSSVVAGGTYDVETNKASGVAGYTFNPSIQFQGLMKDDCFIVFIPKVEVAAGGKITVETSLGGAAAAAGHYIAEYSADGTAWTEFDGIRTINVDGSDYSYHVCTTNSTDKKIRYTYSRDVSVDPGYTILSAAVKSAINGQLFVRLRANGLTGGSADGTTPVAVQTKGGWSEVKFLEVSFD